MLSTQHLPNCFIGRMASQDVDSGTTWFEPKNSDQFSPQDQFRTWQTLQRTGSQHKSKNVGGGPSDSQTVNNTPTTTGSETHFGLTTPPQSSAKQSPKKNGHIPLAHADWEEDEIEIPELRPWSPPSGNSEVLYFTRADSRAAKDEIDRAASVPLSPKSTSETNRAVIRRRCDCYDLSSL